MEGGGKSGFILMFAFIFSCKFTRLVSVFVRLHYQQGYNRLDI